MRRCLEGGVLVCIPLPNIFFTKLTASGTPIEASIPRKPPYCPVSLHHTFLCRCHFLNQFVKFNFLWTNTITEYFPSTFSAPKLSSALAKAPRAGLLKGRANPNIAEKRFPPRCAVFSICVWLNLRSTLFLFRLLSSLD